MTLEQKIQLAINHIRFEYIKNNGNLFISFSGGKDSTVMRDIALEIYPDLPVVFSNTTNELAEVLRYVKTFPNVITVVPNLSFTQVIEKHGFPLVSKEVSQKVSELKHTQSKKLRLNRLDGNIKGHGKTPEKWRYLAEQPFDVTHKCCQILKKDPLEKWAKQAGLKPIIALMADESRLRQQLALFGDSDKKVYPFLRSGWTEADIWAYAELKGIRFAECYYDRTENGVLLKGRDRTGCEYCGFGITLEENDRFERSRLTSPKRFEKIMAVENNGVNYAEAIGIIKDSSRKPIIDLYGATFQSITHYQDRGERYYHMDSTIEMKKCPHCDTKNINQTPVFYTGFFIDTPHPTTKEKRVISLRWNAYDCDCCHNTMSSDLHMFNFDLNVTERLIQYIADNLEFKLFNQVLDETGLTEDALLNIFQNSFVVRQRFQELQVAA